MNVRTLPRLALVALFAGLVLFASHSDADAARRLVFKGKTAQNYNIRVTVIGKRVYLIRFKIRLRCLDGGILFDDLSDFEATRLRAKGRFADLQFGSTDEVRWRGRLRGRTVRGMLRVKDKVRGSVPCDSGQVGFAVRR